MADKNKQGDFYSRPKELGKWEGFKQFLWNSETSELLGRTGSSWGKLMKKKFDFFHIRLKILQRYVTLWKKKHGGLFSSRFAHIYYSLEQ